MLLKALIWSVILIMRFVRASSEAGWPFHIHTLKLMLPYFAAAGHWHCLRYASVCLMKMTKLPKNLLKKVLEGEHAMRHQNGIWNSIWSDIMIGTTVMQYGHDSNGMTGITFNEKALNRWAKILHISSIMGKNLLDLKEASTSRDVSHHKEENRSRIVKGEKDREKIRNFLSTCIHPFYTENHPAEVVNIHNGKLSNNDIDIDKSVEIGSSEQVRKSHRTLPEGFYNPLSKQVKSSVYPSEKRSSK